MSILTEDAVRAALREVIDPEVGLDVWTMGLIYAVTGEAGKLTVEMTLTTPGCPMSSYLTGEVKAALERLEGVCEVDVRLVFDPPWHPAMIDHDGVEQLRGS
ncbi:MAG: metal-sulfur cluster assembly factor [Myxococcota bacterium]